MSRTLQLGDKTLSFPLIQGGMGVGISLSNLAGSVMKEGCLGVISAAHPGYRREGFRLDSIKVNCEAIIDEVKKAREIACGNGIMGINIMVASKDYIEYVKAAVKAKVDAIISGAGLPLDLPKYVEDKSILLAPIVSSAKAAKLICKVWDKRHQVTPDFIVVEGSEAGGHLGFKKEDLMNGTCESLEDIFKEVRAEVEVYKEKYNKEIPIFVAGGVFDGKDIARYLKLGADGVQMGTRFIGTYECDADDAFKQALIDCTEEDIEIVHSPSGFPGRGLGNEFMYKTRAIGNISMKKCLLCLAPCTPIDTPYCISEALINSAKGNVRNGLVFTGVNGHRLNKLVHVHDLISELKQETYENGGWQ